MRFGVKTTTGGAKNGLVKFTFWNKKDMVCKSHFFIGELFKSLFKTVSIIISY